MLLLLLATGCGLRMGGDAVVVGGRLRVVNGVDEVPRGLFGVHATPLTAERIAEWGVEAERRILFAPTGQPSASLAPMLMDCLYDRYRPALQLSEPGSWAATLRRLGAHYAAAARPASTAVPSASNEERGTNSEQTYFVEFWNEPYLNWGTKPGVNYDGAHYDQAEPVAGQQMTIRGQAKPLAGMVWDGTRAVAVRQAGGPVDYVATRFLPEDKRVGEAWSWRGRDYLVEERWWGRDSGQARWWAGPVNRELYQGMLAAFAAGFRSPGESVDRTDRTDRTDSIDSRQSSFGNPPLVVGWGFHLNQDEWSAWEALHRPLIDLAHEWIDGYNEHHYGGDTRMVAATYETAHAYAMGRHGKRLGFYNTEAGGMLDPERPGVSLTRPEGEEVRRDLGAFTYFVRDVVHLIDVCPDKAVTRFAHEAHQNGGEPLAFQMLKPLRGKLLEVVSPAAEVWAVASLAGDRLCLALFNDGAAARQVPLRLTAPEGTHFMGGSVARVVVESGAAGQDRLAMRQLEVAARSRRQQMSLALGRQELVVLTMRLSGAPELSGLRRVVARQFVSADILLPLTPAAKTLEIDLPGELLARAESATLRLVTQGWRGGEAVQVNGRKVDLGSGQGWIRDYPLDMSGLTERTRLTVGGEGGRLCAASIFLVEGEGVAKSRNHEVTKP